MPVFAHQRSGFIRAMSDAGLKPTVVHHNLTPAELYEQARLRALPPCKLQREPKLLQLALPFARPCLLMLCLLCMDRRCSTRAARTLSPAARLPRCQVISAPLRSWAVNAMHV